MGPANPGFSPGDIPLAAAQVAAPIAIVIVPPSDILYAVVSPQSICGLDPVNLKIPATLSDGDAAMTLNVGRTPAAGKTTVPIKN